MEDYGITFRTRMAEFTNEEIMYKWLSDGNLIKEKYNYYLDGKDKIFTLSDGYQIYIMKSLDSSKRITKYKVYLHLFGMNENHLLDDEYRTISILDLNNDKLEEWKSQLINDKFEMIQNKLRISKEHIQKIKDKNE